MANYFDIFMVSIIGLAAAGFLFRSLSKTKTGCGSSCGSCSSGCQTAVKKFSAKTIPIKQLS